MKVILVEAISKIQIKCHADRPPAGRAGNRGMIYTELSPLGYARGDNLWVLRLVLVLSCVFASSCNSVDSEKTPNFSIQTDSASYSVFNELSVKTTFLNNLGKEVNILNNGCGFPSFILEKMENEKWDTVGGPICPRILVAPTKLENGKMIESVVSMYLEDRNTSGSYRMIFFIETNENNQSIGSKYSVSNKFQIIKH